MIQRPRKVRSLDAVNMWTLAEMGTERGKKIHKKAIKKKRRVFEKQEFKKEINDFYREGQCENKL